MRRISGGGAAEAFPTARDAVDGADIVCTVTSARLPVPATSYGIAVAAANVPVPAGSVIMMMDNEHTSHRYAWYELAKQKDARVVTVQRRPDEQ